MDAFTRFVEQYQKINRHEKHYFNRWFEIFHVSSFREWWSEFTYTVSKNVFDFGRKYVIKDWMVPLDTTVFIQMLTYTYVQETLSLHIIGRITSNLRPSKSIHCVNPTKGSSLRCGREWSYGLIYFLIWIHLYARNYLIGLHLRPSIKLRKSASFLKREVWRIPHIKNLIVR